MPDANLVMLFIAQVAGSIILWISTLVLSFAFLVVFVVRVKETFFS
jgi:hypothetical protein